MKLISIALLLILSSCSGLMPDVATITHDICDSVVSVEIDRDAFKEDTDVHVIVDIINKDVPK
jgi:hypothetical protein